jgi:iron complex transport system substrate-binding protein
MPQASRPRRLRCRSAFVWLSVLGLLAPAASDAALPRVASINLCADQLLLELGDRAQILTVSWLAADPEESVLADRARLVPLNYGTAEELLGFAPDLVLAGTLTGEHTRALLARLGYRVIALPPANSLAEIAANVRIVADAIGQRARGERVVADMLASLRELERTRPVVARDAVVVRPGGFTVGGHELAHELMRIAGLRNVAAAEGLDRWGSLSMETLARSAPELLILHGYRAGEPSLANAVLEHPALARIRSSIGVVTVPNAYWACGVPQSVDSIMLMREGPER